MGAVAAMPTSPVVLPEILTYSDQSVLLVHGVENGKEFWWPPGAYWLAQKACHLAEEQPDDWVRRVLREQVRASLSRTRLRSVEFIDRSHPPVLVYEAQLSDRPLPSPDYNFDEARYFPLDALPENLGRDARHGQWLRSLLHRIQPTLAA